MPQITDPVVLSVEQVCYRYATNFNEWRGVDSGFDLAETVLKRLRAEGATDADIKQFMLDKISAFNAHN